MSKQQQEKKIDYVNPIQVSEDVWFYPTPKGFDFVVWITGRDGNRVVSQFRVTHKKLLKYINHL